MVGTTPAEGNLSLLVDDLLDLPAQPVTLRVGVASRALAKAGSIQLPVEVPKVSSDSLQMSNVVLGFVGGPPMEGIGQNLIGPLVPFQPTTARWFHQSHTLRVFARLFWTSPEPSATATVAIHGPGAPAAMTLVLPNVGTASKDRQAVLDTPLPLKGLTPGDYMLEVAASVASGQPALRAVPFTIR